MPRVTRTFTLCIRLGCAVAALAAAYACDARTPTAPAPALTPVSLRGDASEGNLLGSVDLAPSSGLSQFAAVPAFTWAFVRVSGKWDVRPNPACGDQPPEWRCSTNDAYSSFAPAPDAFAGPVRVAMFRDGTLDEFLLLRAFGGPDEGIGLTQREIARSVSAAPALLNPTVQRYGNTGESVASYIIDGSYTVTVTEIASPLRVTEGAAEAGGTRTYTVEPLYGLQYINPSGWTPSSDPPGAPRWYFVPGEDVDPTAPNSDPPWTINECRNLTTCRWQPPGPGRVQVSAFVETRRARARSATDDPEPPLPPEQSRVQVTCSPAGLVRGDTVDCTATVVPNAAFRVVTRTARGHGFTITDTLNKSYGAGEGDHWKGQAVADTRVTYSVVVTEPTGERRLRGNGSFSVSPRAWTVYEITNPTIVREVLFPMIPAPDAQHQRFGAFDITRYRPDSTAIAKPGSGPNRGLIFFADQPQFDGRIGYIWLHPAMYPPSAGYGGGNPLVARWYNDQNGQGTGTCTASGMAVLVAEAERHEGVTLAPNSHLGISNRLFREFGLHRRVEELFRMDSLTLRRDAENIWLRYKRNTWRPVQLQFDSTEYSKVWNTVNCVPDFNVNDAH